MSKVLILDIEISPSLAAVWGLWKQNINLTNLLGESEIMCWAAKWRGDSTVMSASSYYNSKETMLRSLHSLLEQADTVVTYNGERFDLKIINQEFLFAGIKPPKPYASVDLLKTMKRRFRGTSNKLDWWLGRLGIGQKTETGGAKLWIDCMHGEQEAWDKMIGYNQDDVTLTEKLFNRVVPWIVDLPVENPSVDADGNVVVTCACGSTHLQRRGYKRTASGLHYRQYQCQTCGKWFRERTSDRTVEKSSVVHAGQV